MHLFGRENGAFDDSTGLVGVRIHRAVEVWDEPAIEVRPKAGQSPRHTLRLFILRLFRVAVVTYAHWCQVAESRQRFGSRRVGMAERAAACTAVVPVACHTEGLLTRVALGRLLETRRRGDELGGETVPRLLLYKGAKRRAEELAV